MDKKHKNWIYSGIFMTVVILLFVVNNSNGVPEKGPYPPNYLESQTESLKLSDYKGKIVILDFWATWCPPCRKGIPDLIELKNEFKDKDVEIIGISLDGITRGGQTAANVEPFIEEYGINYPIIRGDEQIVYSFGGIRSIPTSYVIDKEGNVISRYEGLIPKSQYVKDIESILKGMHEVKENMKAPDFNLPLVNTK